MKAKKKNIGRYEQLTYIIIIIIMYLVLLLLLNLEKGMIGKKNVFFFYNA